MSAVLLTGLLDALLDYAGYNLSSRGGWLRTYRILHTAYRSGFALMLLHFFGWQHAAAYLILAWSFAWDFAYYVWAFTLNIRGWEGAYEVVRIMDKPTFEHSWWTPVGLFHSWAVGEKRGASPAALAIQTAVALALAFYLTR